MKPTYEELLEALFDVTQALRNTLVQGGQMSSADRDQRWTIAHKAEGICSAGRHAHYRQKPKRR
jgi:hypothetical protein